MHNWRCVLLHAQMESGYSYACGCVCMCVRVRAFVQVFYTFCREQCMFAYELCGKFMFCLHCSLTCVYIDCVSWQLRQIVAVFQFKCVYIINVCGASVVMAFYKSLCV